MQLATTTANCMLTSSRWLVHCKVNHTCFAVMAPSISRNNHIDYAGAAATDACEHASRTARESQYCMWLGPTKSSSRHRPGKPYYVSHEDARQSINDEDLHIRRRCDQEVAAA